MYIVYHLRRLVYRTNAAHQADCLHARRSSGGMWQTIVVK